MKHRLFSVILAVMLLVSLLSPIYAADIPPMGDPPPMPGEGGAGGGPAAAGQEFATYEEVRSYAGIQIENGISTQSPEGSSFSGSIELSDTGAVTNTHISGMKLVGDELSNGVAFTMGSETDVFTIGGEETTFEVDGKAYNTVIQVASGEGNNDAGYEAVHGVGVGYSTGELRVENSYISSEGPRSTPVYGFSTAAPLGTSLVVLNSKLVAHSDSIWMPPFKLLAGGARATLMMTRNNSWFYGSEVESNNWGAVSQDSVDAMTYMVNSTGVSTEGGYGTYLTYGMRLYGSDLYAGQYGVFMCGSSDIITDTGKAALEDSSAMEKAPEFQVDADRISHVAAPFNAIVVHNSLPDYTMVAKGEFKNSVISTLTEDLPENVTPMAYNDDFFMPGVDILGSGNGCGASYFYNKNLYGSLALIRSMNADFTFDNAETYTSNGVLVHSVVTYDPPSASGYLTPDQSETVAGVSTTLKNGSYEGDILHQDYHRSMTVTVEDTAALTGKAVSGTYAAWNDLWSEESLIAALKSDGYAADYFGNDQWVEDVQTNLILSQDTVYEETDNVGISMEVAGTWTVTGDSSLKSLTIDDGGIVTTPNGCTMTVYTGCDASNSLLFYDESTGIELSELVPGTYENVVIRISGTPIPEETPDETSEASSPLPAETTEPAPPAPSATEKVTTVEAEEPANVLLPVILIVAVVLVGVVTFVLVKKKQ